MRRYTNLENTFNPQWLTISVSECKFVRMSVSHNVGKTQHIHVNLLYMLNNAHQDVWLPDAIGEQMVVLVVASS